MSKTIFNLVQDMNFNKIPWDEQSEVDKKQFNAYMVNRILSMNIDLIEMVNYIQQYTPSMSNVMIYDLYLSLLPKNKSFNKYIGNTSEGKYIKLAQLFAEQLQISIRESSELINRCSKSQIYEELQRYGFSKAQIKELYG